MSIRQPEKVKSVLVGIAVIVAVGMCSLSWAASTDLEDTVRATLTRHERIQALKANRDSAEFTYRAAKGGFLPQVDVNAGIGLESVDDSTTRDTPTLDNGFEDRKDLSLALTQLLWDGNRTRAQVDVAAANRDAVKMRLIDNIEGLALDAVTAHLDVSLQRRIVTLVDANIASHEEILKFQEERQALGAGSIADVVQTQARLERSRATREEGLNRLRNAEARYRRLTGTEPMDLAEVAGPVALPRNLEAAVDAARIGNPRIAERKRAIWRAEGQVVLARSRNLPLVEFQAQSSFNDQVGATDEYAITHSAQVRLSWNLFNGGEDQQEILAAAARERQERLTMDETIQDVFREVTIAWSDLEAARRRVSSYGTTVDLNRKTRDVYREQFQVGQRSLLDVLDAENELFGTSVQLENARVESLTTTFRILALTGNLTSMVGLDREEFLR